MGFGNWLKHIYIKCTPDTGWTVPKHVSKFVSCLDINFDLSKIDELVKLLKSEFSIFGDEDVSKQNRVNALFNCMQAILEYKKRNPRDFEELFRGLEKFCKKRKNDSSIDEELKKLF